MSSGMLSRTRSVSNGLEAPHIVLPKGKEAATDAPFEPCAATASHFLFAQGSTVVVLHHDTLAQEKRFSNHSEDIQFISVDNVSERGQGRLVVTYDVGKTAIVWDLFTGEALSRFASYEPLVVAAWMRNGNIAFGNEKGEVILFEPSSSEHVSSRTIFDPITALAPSSDCKTYAIGYRNGSILLATLQPQFTIVHTINTARSPSPIAMLNWHASSSKQKSDMLAIQTSDGDLRVWSVPKPPAAGAPRVIRMLKRDDAFVHGRNWISWSRNGRVVQFSEGETWAWDVRTKDVNYVPIQTVEFVRGIAAYGPTASLFTLGPDYTVQQYDIDAGTMVANVRCLPPTIPPTPPEEHMRLHFNSASDGDEVATSPVGRTRRDQNSWEMSKPRSETPQSANNRSQHSSGSRQSDSKAKLHELTSPSKSERTATTFSTGQYAYHYPAQAANPVSTPMSPGSARPGLGARKGSRLRQEVVMSPMSPEEVTVPELFPFVRARLSDVPYQPAKALDESTMTPDDLRRQMLSVVFGWEDDIDALIQDELAQQTYDTQNAVILAKWLGYDSDSIAEVMGRTPHSATLDWVRLALGTLDSRPETKKIGQVFVEKMLSKGEIHLAVVVLLCMGDRNDAIEVYVSRNCYLEAVLLTCLLMPGDWQRQSHLVRKWGEHVVENSQQHLAIRCFSCTGIEPAEPWTSPTAQMLTQMTSPIAPVISQHERFESRTMMPSLPPLPPLPVIPQMHSISRHAQTPVAMPAPPTPFRTAAATGARITPQTGGLKLITSFGSKPGSFKFPGLKTDDMTPIQQQNVTPIAESAIDRSALSPGGLGSYRLNNVRSINAALSAGPIGRNRLPSIGETPIDVEAPSFLSKNQGVRAPPTPADSGSDREKEKKKTQAEKPEQPPMLLTSARYTPKPQDDEPDPAPTPQTALGPSSIRSNFPRSSSLSESREETPIGRNGPRAHKPEGLSLQVLSVHEVRTHAETAFESSQRPGTTDSHTTTNFDLSPPPSGQSSRVKSPSISGRSLDQYISSLEQAQHYEKNSKSRNSNRSSRPDGERKKSRTRKAKYEDGADMTHEIPASKRSPSSPVPMSPDDFRMMNSASVESFEGMYSSANASAPDLSRKASRRRRESEATDGGRRRHRSRSTQPDGRLKHPSRDVSRRPSPTPEGDHNYRGRSKARKEGSTARSPSSPLPMVPSEEDLQGRSSVDPALRFVSQDRSRFNRSSSRRPERGVSAHRDVSPDPRRPRDRSESRQRGEGALSRKSSVSTREKRRKKREASEHNSRPATSHAEAIERLDFLADNLKTTKLRHGDRRKELAQAELEARRLSLARRPSAPNIPMPGNMHTKSASEGHPAPPILTRNHTDQPFRGHSKTPSYEYQDYNANANGRGRPGTPRAMQHPSDIDHSAEQMPINNYTNGGEYQLQARTYSANFLRDKNGDEMIDSMAPVEVPDGMPRHPAFDHRVGGSRGNSRSRSRVVSPSGRRNTSSSRGPQDRRRQPLPEETPPMVIGSPESGQNGFVMISSDGPAIIPELQHLAVPPPPPPPPAPPKDRGLKIHTDLSNAASIPLPRSAIPGYDTSDPKSATPGGHGHQRNKSGSESQLMGKLRGFTDRMRSSSRPRDNQRNPYEESGMMSPYETNVLPRHTLNSVLESR